MSSKKFPKDLNIGDKQIRALIARPDTPIVHVTGDSETSIMSQKGVTNAIGALLDNADTAPTLNSDNFVTSGGVYTYVNSTLGNINTALAVILGEGEES